MSEPRAPIAFEQYKREAARLRREAYGEFFRSLKRLLRHGRRRAYSATGPVWGQSSATRIASSMPGQGGVVTMTKARGAVPRLRN